jgi:hypothetical protein
VRVREVAACATDLDGEGGERGTCSDLGSEADDLNYGRRPCPIINDDEVRGTEEVVTKEKW